MCGRFTQTKTLAEVAGRFRAKRGALPDLPPRYNVAPSETVPVIVPEEDTRWIRPMQWGLVPSWAKHPSGGAKCINARAETLLERPTYRKSFERRRALIPIDGFYEWRRPDRQPFWIARKDRGLFALAGLWDAWRSESGRELLTFTIVTVPANEDIRPIHHRMPAILRLEDEDRWTARGSVDSLETLLTPYAAGELDLMPVSPAVNSPMHDSADCLKPPPQPSLFEV